MAASNSVESRHGSSRLETAEDQKGADLTSISSLKLLHVVDNQGAECVAGLTSLGHELYVVRRVHSQVEVYDCDAGFTLTRHIPVDGLEHPMALAACSRHQTLFISDGDESKDATVVHKVHMVNGSCSQWSVSGYPVGISVTKNHTVLVTMSDVQQIVEYKEDGVKVRQIKLDASIKGVKHSVQLTTGQFAVSHGAFTNDDSTSHRVCIVDKDGRIVYSYGGEQGHSVGELSWPKSIEIDGHDNILVADNGNNRLVLLSPQLKHLTTVSSLSNKRKLNGPKSLHLDTQTARLFVGEWMSGRVLVGSLP